jgi:5'-methylthioadenosine phosphorylase
MKLGVIGGTGLYGMDERRDARKVWVDTPFGPPSDEFVSGAIDGVEVFFLPRHGVGHRLLPSEINHRANVWALKRLGVSRVISISAVGSLREEFRPRDLVLPDQYFDRTKRGAEHTFFGGGIVAHIPFAEPVCPDLRAKLARVAADAAAAVKSEAQVHPRGTYVNMEGPAFSTRAESEFHRRCGFDIVGMTSLAEAKLCREAEMCYATVAMVTDYDCWREDESVTLDGIMGHLRANAELARQIVRRAVKPLAGRRACACGRALMNAIVTAPEHVPSERRRALAPIIGKYLSRGT